MDIDRSVIEGAPPAGQQTCAGLGDSAEQQSEQRPRQRKAEEGDLMSRDALQQALLNLAYDNTGSMCYANCSVTCLIWACLSRHNFTVGEWGEPASQLCEVLRHTDGLFQIDGQEWYHSLVANWQQSSRVCWFIGWHLHRAAAFGRDVGCSAKMCTYTIMVTHISHSCCRFSQP